MKTRFVSLSPRPGVTQNLELIEPDHAVACAILFAGGHGVLGISEVNGEVRYGREINFLVRSRMAFAAHGLIVAVVDAPSDRSGDNGMLSGFRCSAEHVTDVDAVVAHLHDISGLLVWLVGTSRGTESAAHAAICGRAGIRGLVLTSSVAVTDAKGMSLTEMPLGAITVPTQVLAHRDDACPVTPPQGAKEIADKLTGAPKVDLAYFSGGAEPESGPCDPLCPHGFFGIEPAVIDRTVTFMRSCTAEQPGRVHESDRTGLRRG